MNWKHCDKCGSLFDNDDRFLECPHETGKAQSVGELFAILETGDDPMYLDTGNVTAYQLGLNDALEKRQRRAGQPSDYHRGFYAGIAARDQIERERLAKNSLYRNFGV